jgi:hypothetical protein
MINHKEGKRGSILVSDRNAPYLSPDLSPKYLVTVGTRWYLLGLTAALEYQRVPSSPNSHKHYRDSNSLGGTTFSQVRDLIVPESCSKSGTKIASLWGRVEDKAPAQSGCLCRSSAPRESLLVVNAVGARFGAQVAANLPEAVTQLFRNVQEALFT